jgi:pSer/pThr/pTyr-binding forkhead associated (FHA) protein
MGFIAAYRNGELVTRRDLSGPMVVGRARNADLWVADIRVSRRHCRIEPEGDGWAVVDLDSRNGTHVGDSAVGRRRHVLADGDQITIGDTVLHFGAGKLAPQRPADPETALAAARGERGVGASGIPEDWKGPLPKPQGRAGYPGQAGGEDVPTGSTMLGYGREESGLAWEDRAKLKGPPPEINPPDQSRVATPNI